MQKPTALTGNRLLALFLPIVTSCQLSLLMLLIGILISLRHLLHHTYKSPLPTTSSYLNNSGCFLPSSLHRGHINSTLIISLFLGANIIIQKYLCNKIYINVEDFYYLCIVKSQEPSDFAVGWLFLFLFLIVWHS